MPKRSKVTELPEKLKEWLDAEMLRRGFADYEQLAVDLKARGGDISKSSLHRYGSAFEARMAQLKAANEQAKALVDAAPDDEDKLGSATLRLAQQRIFQLFMDMEIDPDDVDVNKLFKSAAEIGKASATHKRFSMDVRREIEAAARRKALEDASATATAAAKKAGLSADGVTALRAAIMGAL